MTKHHRAFFPPIHSPLAKAYNFRGYSAGQTFIPTAFFCYTDSDRVLCGSHTAGNSVPLQKKKTLKRWLLKKKKKRGKVQQYQALQGPLTNSVPRDYDIFFPKVVLLIKFGDYVFGKA